MRANNYFYSCSKELLNQLLALSHNDNDEVLSNLKDNIDLIWVLISTSLLLSENLLKNHNIYKIINNKQFIMLENILDKNIMDDEYEKFNSFFLDENNKIINPFHNLIDDSQELKKMIEDDQKLKDYTNYGCNTSVITNEILDYKKLIIMVRNSLAHSNYEVIDENYLRLYHYNKNNQLDFNVKINIIMVLTIIDELNELASKLYEPFLNEYYNRDAEIQFANRELPDDQITEYLLGFKVVNQEEIIEILEEAKKEKDYYPDFSKDNNFDKFSIIYNFIYNKIKPVCDYGIILNEVIYYLRKNNKIIDDYFYEKYGYYDYFNSDFYKSNEQNNKGSLKENKFKILLFSYLNTLLLYNYNSNHEIDYQKIDFSKMRISENIKKKYIESKYKNIKNLFNKLKIQEINLLKISQSINKLKEQMHNAKEQNNFLTNILPNRIEDLKKQYNLAYSSYLENKKQAQQELYNKLFEISDLQDNVNLNLSLSEFIINHLRNSLAHGYVTFPNGINYNEIFETEICFEDFEKNNKEIMTFQGTIKIRDLIEELSKDEVINALFNNGVTK